MLAIIDFFDKLPSTLREIGFGGLVDMIIVTLVIYTFMVAVKRTRRSGLIFTGILIIGAVYVLARKFDLQLTATLLQGFFAAIALALVVIFQEDLRYFFERVALWWAQRRLPLYKRSNSRLPSRQVEILARALGDLARARIGALVVVQGKDIIARHLTGGEDVDGLLSEPLIKSIFDPHSVGHDGAVIVEGSRVARLGCHLPLSRRLQKLPGKGTRHAAALGLAELSDALCIVVSEERGTISIARGGEISTLADPGDLVGVLEAFFAEVAPVSTRKVGWDFIVRNFREKAVALGLAVLLWTAFVYRSQSIESTFNVPVTFTLLPASLTITNYDPSHVLVTLSGQRKDFGFMKPGDVKLSFGMIDARPGRRTLPITVRELTFPEGLEVEDIEPRQVRVHIVEKPGTNEVAVPKP